MNFGEIVEPSTRALIDDELDEYPEYIEPTLEWQGDFKLPKIIKKLIFIETTRIKSLTKSLILQDNQFLCKLNNGTVEIYQLNDDFIISYTENSLTTGELVEIFSEWFKKSEYIYCITSQPIATYLNVNQRIEKTDGSIIRMLTNGGKVPEFRCENLEIPNLVSGIGAQILSYCYHTGLNCTLYVLYMDASPIDSINARPFVELVKSLKLPIHEDFKQADFANNLYW